MYKVICYGDETFNELWEDSADCFNHLEFDYITTPEEFEKRKKETCLLLKPNNTTLHIFYPAILYKIHPNAPNEKILLPELPLSEDEAEALEKILLAHFVNASQALSQTLRQAL